MPAILILIVVGFMIGAWMVGGTIPMMIYYGLKIIDPQFLLITAFSLRPWSPYARALPGVPQGRSELPSWGLVPEWTPILRLWPARL